MHGLLYQYWINLVAVCCKWVTVCCKWSNSGCTLLGFEDRDKSSPARTLVLLILMRAVWISSCVQWGQNAPSQRTLRLNCIIAAGNYAVWTARFERHAQFEGMDCWDQYNGSAQRPHHQQGFKHRMRETPRLSGSWNTYKLCYCITWSM